MTCPANGMSAAGVSVDVIIPAHNSAATIVTALESLRNQTVRPSAVIVVDDASADETVRVVEEYLRNGLPGCRVTGLQRREVAGLQSYRVTEGPGGSEPLSVNSDPSTVSPPGCRRVTPSSCSPVTLLPCHSVTPPFSVKLIRMSSNSGPAAARNRGVAEASGEWVAFLDADDAWLPWRLSRQFEELRRTPSCVMCCGETCPIGAMPDAAMPGPTQVLEPCDFLDRNPVATSTVLLRRDAFVEVGGFDPAFRGPEDYDLWLRLAARRRILRLSEALAGYRSQSGSLSMDDRKFLPQVLRVLGKAFASGGALTLHPEWRSRAESAQYWNASWMAFCRGDRPMAVRWWWASFRRQFGMEPRIPRPWFRLLARYVAGVTP